jgi:hypothetical protein
MLSGSTLGVVISGGCSGVSDVAGRVGAVKIFNSTETPEEHRLSLTAVSTTGASTYIGTLRTVGSFILKGDAAWSSGRLREPPKNVS